MRSIFYAGSLLWAGGTLALRVAGQHLLRPHHALQTAGLYLAGFLLFAFLAPRLCRRMRLPRDQWPGAVTLLILPTLILDALSCAYFSTAYPNLDPAAAGIFGGWMLICCGGAVAGAWRPA